MRVIVTGSRNWPDDGSVVYALRQMLGMDVPIGSGLTVVHGACPDGADKQAAAFCDWARRPYADPGEVVTEEPYPARWQDCGPICPDDGGKHRQHPQHRPSWCPLAGFNRNQAMADAGADLCLAFLRRRSPGTRDMITRAERAGITVRLTEIQ